VSPVSHLILAGLEAGGLRYAADSTALRTAAGELAAAALDAHQHIVHKTASTPDRRSKT
jgi:hypothetical protein